MGVYQKCRCPFCAGNVKYPSRGGGEVIGCPHCLRHFKLPQVNSPESVAKSGVDAKKLVFKLGIALLVLAILYLVYSAIRR